MARFCYQGRADGELVDGVMEGTDPDHVAAQLQNRGITPLNISEIAQSKVVGKRFSLLLSRPQVDDLILFSRQMAALSRSGVPLVRAFQGLIDSTVNMALKKAMTGILADIQAGRDLSLAMAEHPHIFDPFFIRVIRVGEEMGRLEDAFAQIFHYLENGKATRQRIANALRYPIFVVMTVIVAMVVVNYYVIPAFVQLFTNFSAELPLATKILLTTSEFTREHGLPILGGLSALFAGFVYSLQTESGRLLWDRLILKMPLVGTLIHRTALARLSRIFVLGSRSGMNMIQILSAVEETVNNQFLAQRIALLRLGVSRGESLVQAASGSNIFTLLVLQMIAVGEETGQIEQMMSEVADFYEQEVDYKIKALSTVIEPLLLLFLAAIVLVLALGIFLPLWELGAGGMAR
jgi:MSHA biogenesis protein MshG